MDKIEVVIKDTMKVTVLPTMPGPKGDPGPPSETYIHDQILASDHWIIEHSLGKFPSVSVVDSGGSVVFGEVYYASQNRIEVMFIGEFSGKAFLN